MCHYLLTWTSRFLDGVTFVDFLLLWGMVTFQCGVWSVLVCYWCLHWVFDGCFYRDQTTRRGSSTVPTTKPRLLDLPRNLLNVSHLLNGPFLYIHTALPGLSDQTTHLWTWARRFMNCTFFFFFVFLCEWPFVSEAIYIFCSGFCFYNSVLCYYHIAITTDVYTIYNTKRCKMKKNGFKCQGRWICNTIVRSVTRHLILVFCFSFLFNF